jgi:hypothetical protein
LPIFWVRKLHVPGTVLCFFRGSVFASLAVLKNSGMILKIFYFLRILYVEIWQKSAFYFTITVWFKRLYHDLKETVAWFIKGIFSFKTSRIFCTPWNTISSFNPLYIFDLSDLSSHAPKTEGTHFWNRSLISNLTVRANQHYFAKRVKVATFSVASNPQNSNFNSHNPIFNLQIFNFVHKTLIFNSKTPSFLASKFNTQKSRPLLNGRLLNRPCIEEQRIYWTLWTILFHLYVHYSIH